jgi:quercetin dioxygenase-like cupin family protein
MKLRLALISTAAVAATSAALALAAGPSPSIGGAAFGSGVLIGVPSTNVHLSHTSGYFMASAIAPPHTTFGWHYHRTPIVVVITAGTLTLYDSSGPKCNPTRYHAGQGFIEPANHIHLARNEGNTRVILYATYVGVSPHLRANPSLLDVVNQKRPNKCRAGVQ